MIKALKLERSWERDGEVIKLWKQPIRVTDQRSMRFMRLHTWLGLVRHERSKWSRNLNWVLNGSFGLFAGAKSPKLVNTRNDLAVGALRHLLRTFNWFNEEIYRLQFFISRRFAFNLREQNFEFNCAFENFKCKLIERRKNELRMPGWRDFLNQRMCEKTSKYSWTSVWTSNKLDLNFKLLSSKSK